MLDQHLQRGSALLGVAGLVGLDGGDQVGEGHVARFEGVGGQGYELDVGEARLEGERQLDGDVHHAAADHHVIDQRPQRDAHPVIGVQGLVSPVELRIALHQFVREVEAELAVPDLVEGAHDRHVAPSGAEAEAGHTALPVDSRVLDEGNSSEVHLDRRPPRLVQLLVLVRPVQGGLHRVC